MTRKEDMKVRCPEKVGNKYNAGVYGCPVEAGYKGHEECSSLPRELLNVMPKHEKVKMCKLCWDMEAVR